MHIIYGLVKNNEAGTCYYNKTQNNNQYFLDFIEIIIGLQYKIRIKPY